MIKVCHFSDWHGRAVQLPAADLYVCTGDMLENFPVKDRDRGSYTYRDWKIDPEHERSMQGRQVNQFHQNGGFRRLMGNPDAPVVCVRGNHDFIDLALMFRGCDVHELISNELLVIKVGGIDLRVTGHRGIPFIYGGWNDETQRPDLIDLVDKMPEADLFLTHYPPAGMLDSSMPPGLSMGGGWAESWGLEGMANKILHKVSSEFVFDDQEPINKAACAAHCFGHIHECGGSTLKVADVIFSNAAQGVNVFDIEPVRSNV